jgi:hypothetical protein
MSTLNGGPGNIVTNGLVLYLDAANYLSYVSGSTTWRDLSSSNLSGSLINGPTYSSGNAGHIRLDGTNDYITLPTIGFAPPSVTVDVWVRQYSSNNIGYIWVMDNYDNPELRLGVSTNKFQVYFYDLPYGYITSTLSTTTLNTSSFFNVTSTITSGSQKVYVNGNLEISTTGNYNTNTTGSLYEQTLGTYNRPSPGYNGYGSYDYGIYKVYNRVLTASEVLQNYNAQKSRFGLT